MSTSRFYMTSFLGERFRMMYLDYAVVAQSFVDELKKEVADPGSDVGGMCILNTCTGMIQKVLDPSIAINVIYIRLGVSLNSDGVEIQLEALAKGVASCKCLENFSLSRSGENHVNRNQICTGMRKISEGIETCGSTLRELRFDCRDIELSDTVQPTIVEAACLATNVQILELLIVQIRTPNDVDSLILFYMARPLLSALILHEADFDTADLIRLVRSLSRAPYLN